MIQISKSNLNRLVILTLIVAGLFLPISKTYAQDSFQFNIRGIAGKISNFLSIKKSAETAPEDKTHREISARKESVQKIFDLTTLEQDDLLNRLSELKDLNNQQEKMRNKLTEFVKENNNGLKEIENRLENAGTLEEIKQLAADFKNWRTLVYNPKTEKVVAFTFVFQGKNILNVASGRLEKVAADLSAYQNALDEKDAKAEEIFRKAESNIREAEELNGQARNLIMIALDRSLTPSKNPKAENKEIARDIADSKAFTEKAMKHIRTAYDEFLQLGKIISGE